VPTRKSSSYSLQYTFITSHRLIQVFFLSFFYHRIPFTSYHFSFHHFPSLLLSQHLHCRTRTWTIVWHCFHVRIFLSHYTHTHTNICTPKFIHLMRIYTCTYTHARMKLHTYIHSRMRINTYASCIYKHMFTYTYIYVIHNFYTHKPNYSRLTCLLMSVAMRFFPFQTWNTPDLTEI
jgi:hypothetical protein